MYEAHSAEYIQIYDYCNWVSFFELKYTKYVHVKIWYVQNLEKV